MDDRFRYAMKLALLNQLYREELISDKEYNAVKMFIKKKHKIYDSHNEKKSKT